MLTIHHLTTSQSERVLWLCEELGIDYKLVRHERLPDTRLAPPALRALTPMGTAPVMEDGDVVMGESGAIVEYIIHKHGGGRLALKPDHPDYAQYLFWFHFANGTLQPLMMRVLTLQRVNVPDDHPYSKAIHERLDRALGAMDARLEKNQWLAGSEFTAADIMSVFSLTTMREFVTVELDPYSNLHRYLGSSLTRPGYRTATERAKL